MNKWVLRSLLSWSIHIISSSTIGLMSSVNQTLSLFQWLTWKHFTVVAVSITENNLDHFRCVTETSSSHLLRAEIRHGSNLCQWQHQRLCLLCCAVSLHTCIASSSAMCGNLCLRLFRRLSSSCTRTVWNAALASVPPLKCWNHNIYWLHTVHQYSYYLHKSVIKKASYYNHKLQEQQITTTRLSVSI